MTTSLSAMQRRWPDQLVRQIANKNFVLIVGAGVSKNSKNGKGVSPPGWATLLSSIAEDLTCPKAKTQVKKLIKQQSFLEAAELVRHEARLTSKEADFLSRIAEMTDGSATTGGKFLPASIHNRLLDLEPDVIVTTNYDSILERASLSGYHVHPYKSETLGAEVRLGTPVLVKVHGSVDSPAELILTRSDYTKLRREGSHVLEVLQALLLTRTALFVGYGFGDPDLHLILENILGARGESPAHYILTGNDLPNHVEDMYRYCYGTTAIRHTAGEYVEIERMLDLLNELSLQHQAGTPSLQDVLTP